MNKTLFIQKRGLCFIAKFFKNIDLSFLESFSPSDTIALVPSEDGLRFMIDDKIINCLKGDGTHDFYKRLDFFMDIILVLERSSTGDLNRISDGVADFVFKKVQWKDDKLVLVMGDNDIVLSNFVGNTFSKSDETDVLIDLARLYYTRDFPQEEKAIFYLQGVSLLNIGSEIKDRRIVRT